MNILPDTLVKLASFGTSGVCVLIVFWCGHTITKLDDKTPAPVFKLYRQFLFLCAFIAVISAITGFALAKNTEHEADGLANAVKESQTSLEQIQINVDKINARIQASESAPPNSPQKLPEAVINEIKAPAANASKEAAEGAQKAANKVKSWTSKRLGF